MTNLWTFAGSGPLACARDPSGKAWYIRAGVDIPGARKLPQLVCLRDRNILSVELEPQGLVARVYFSEGGNRTLRLSPRNIARFQDAFLQANMISYHEVVQVP